MADATEELPPPKHILFNDVRTGKAFVMEIPATSPWHELLPQHQVVEPVSPAIWTPRREP